MNLFVEVHAQQKSNEGTPLASGGDMVSKAKKVRTSKTHAAEPPQEETGIRPGKNKPATVLGKLYALQKLAERRERFARKDAENRPESAYTIYYCCACGAKSSAIHDDHRHLQTPKKFCSECQALKECGWLDG